MKITQEQLEEDGRARDCFEFYIKQVGEALRRMEKEKENNKKD